MKKTIAKYLRHAAERLDPAPPPSWQAITTATYGVTLPTTNATASHYRITYS